MNKVVLASDRLSWLATKIRDSQLHQHSDVVFLDPKNGRVQYRKSQKGRNSGWENKSNLVIKKSSRFKASIYYHKIYGYQ